MEQPVEDNTAERCDVDLSNIDAITSDYDFPLFVYADMNACCQLDYGTQLSHYKLMFGDYLFRYLKSLTYTAKYTNRVNYRLTKNLLIRTYYSTMENNNGSDDSGDNNKYSVTADCEDECSCCYSKNCPKANAYNFDEDAGREIPNDHVCQADECDCEIYYGDKWHTYIGDFVPIIKINGERNGQLETYFSDYNCETSFNNLAVDQLAVSLAAMTPLQAVLSILLYRPFSEVANDK